MPHGASAGAARGLRGLLGGGGKVTSTGGRRWAAECGVEEEVAGWRLRRNGFARIETGAGIARLCMGPSEALYYSNAEISDGGFGELPHRGGVLELKVRLTGLHSGSAGWGFWNYSMRVDRSNPVWFIYLNAPGPYPLKGLFAQSGRYFAPIVLFQPVTLPWLLGRLLPPLAPIRIVARSPSRPGLDLASPHVYRVEWRSNRAVFMIDGEEVAVLPAEQTPARVDIWIDNAVFLPRRGDPGMVYRHVTLENTEETCLEVLGV